MSDENKIPKTAEVERGKIEAMPNQESAPPVVQDLDQPEVKDLDQPVGQESSKSLENKKVEEMHNNIRHITQLALNWFVFFVTINYATMGWLAVGSANLNPLIVLIIAAVFIWQNYLGVISLNEVETEIRTMSAYAVCYEDNLPVHNAIESYKEIKTKSIPIQLLTNLKINMKWVLYSLIGAWVLYALIRFIPFTMQVFSEIRLG